MPASALERVFHALVAMGYRDFDDGPLAGLSLRGFDLWDRDGGWLLTVAFDTPYWKVHAWG